jgi:hypothetical protein
VHEDDHRLSVSIVPGYHRASGGRSDYGDRDYRDGDYGTAVVTVVVEPVFVVVVVEETPEVELVVELTGTPVDVVVVEIGRVVVVVVVVVVSVPPGRDVVVVVVVVAGCVGAANGVGVKVPGMPPLVPAETGVDPFGGWK